MIFSVHFYWTSTSCEFLKKATPSKKQFHHLEKLKHHWWGKNFIPQYQIKTFIILRQILWSMESKTFLSNGCIFSSKICNFIYTQNDVGQKSWLLGGKSFVDLADKADTAEIADFVETAENAEIGKSAEIAEKAKNFVTADTADFAEISEVAEFAEIAETADIADNAKIAYIADIAEFG